MVIIKQLWIQGNGSNVDIYILSNKNYKENLIFYTKWIIEVTKNKKMLHDITKMIV